MWPAVPEGGTKEKEAGLLRQDSTRRVRSLTSLNSPL